MKKKEIKILFLINTITSYQIDFFSELGKLCKIKIIFNDDNYNNYNFKFKKQKNFFFLNKVKNKSIKIKETILNFDPDYTIIGGYRLKYSDQAIQLLNKKKKDYFFWLERLNKLNFLKYKIVKFLIKKKAIKSNGLFCVGNDAKKNYFKFNKNIFNLPYSINIEKFKKKKKYFHGKKTNFLFVGQLIKRKGIDLILKSFDLLTPLEKKKIRLTIIGEGPYKKDVKVFLKDNSFVAYKNFLNRKKLIPIFEKNDVFIFPSIFDGWGVAPLEAMASSMSLILSRDVGMTEILKKNKNKIINYSKDELLFAIKNLIKNKNDIEKDGKMNKKILLNSLCNSKNSAKYLLDIFKKL